MEYRYSLKDCLKHPQTYQYSEYGGMSFVKSYLNSRKFFIGKIANNLKNKTSFKSINDLYKNQNKKFKRFPLNKVQIIKTEKILWNILFLTNGHGQDKEAYYYLSRLLKKYETKKRIYDAYGLNFEEKSENYKNFENYILLSLNLLLLYEKTKSLKFLNCALKLDDMLCSIFVGLDKEELNLLLLALNLELKEIKKLYKAKGVRI